LRVVEYVFDRYLVSVLAWTHDILTEVSRFSTAVHYAFRDFTFIRPIPITSEPFQFIFELLVRLCAVSATDRFIK